MIQFNNLRFLLSRFLSWYGIFFGVICTVFLILSFFQDQDNIAQLCALGYFLLALLLGWYAKSFGLSVIVFLIPLLPTLNNQLTSIFPGLHIPVSISGIRVVSGFVVGVILERLILKRLYFQELVLPGIISAACIFFTISVALAVSRNLWLSGSVFSFKGLLYNATHFYINSWKDDYYPLTDLLTFGLGSIFIACVAMVLREEKDPTTTLIRPILWGVIVAALWALIQNRTGLGLSYSSASGNRYYQMFGYASTGFQPDIHAFSAHMLLGAVGAWGCLFVKKQHLSRWLIIAAVVMGWAGLWASKSRGSILLASLIYLIACAVLLWRKNKLYFFIATTIALFTVLAVYLFHRWGLSIIPIWLIQYVESLPKLHISNLEALNAHFGHRAEIYHAAIRMFQAFPLAGLGQGDFYTMSGIQEFAKSRFLSQINGENAHNYFLQTLTETGLIGAVIFSAVFVTPWFKSTDKKSLYPAYTMVLAIALGNVFAHALLVRENLFLLCVVIALLFVISGRSQRTITPAIQLTIFWKLIISALIGFAFILTTQEVYRSFGNPPYVYGAKCYISSPLKNNEWTPGLFDIQIIEGTKRIEFHLSDAQPDVIKNPLGMTISLLDDKSNLISIQQITIKQLGPQVINVPLEHTANLTAFPARVKIELSRCFTPRNFGVNSDTRRLGVLLKDLVFLK